MKRFAALAALAAVAVAVGIYFGTQNESSPPVPKAQQSPILERAKLDGLISSYRVLAPHSAYEVTGGQIRLRRVQVCDPNSAGPCFMARPLIYVEYRPQARRKAEAIWRLAQTVVADADVKLFEVTPGLPNSHTPDARIMLIPKAGA